MALVRYVFEALGGECELYAVGFGEERLREGARWIAAMHERFTRFSPESELSRFNARAGEWVAVSEDLAALLGECLRAYDESEGLVNAAILPALLAAGYTRTFSDGPTAVTASVPVPALRDVLTVDGRRARLRPRAAIDLGGIAKGWLADRLAADLGENVLVNLSGDLYARGGGETGDGWPVGVGPQTVLLKDLGAATSGRTRRAWGEDLHHLVDPRTGRPAATDLREVSVIAYSAADAEIYAKTAFLLGSAKAPEYLEPRAQGWFLKT